MNKQCGSCKYASKPVKGCACNHKVKHLDEVAPMKYNGANMPYCEAFKPMYRGRK